VGSKIRALAADIKLHHSVFALPWAILATVLAAHRTGGLKIGQLVLILICMVSARTVAMVANRLLDAEFDAANPRTAERAVPSGRVTRSFGWVSLGYFGGGFPGWGRGVLGRVSQSLADHSGGAGVAVFGRVFADEAVHPAMSLLSGGGFGARAGLRVDCDHRHPQSSTGFDGGGGAVVDGGV